MSKKVVKIINIVFVVLMILSMTSGVFALTPDQIKGTEGVTGTAQIQSMGQKVVGVLQTIGVVISVIVLIVLGIKYMMGSAEEKAEYKKTMIPYLVGALLIFAASMLANVVYQFANGLNS